MFSSGQFYPSCSRIKLFHHRDFHYLTVGFISVTNLQSGWQFHRGEKASNCKLIAFSPGASMKLAVIHSENQLQWCCHPVWSWKSQHFVLFLNYRWCTPNQGEIFKLQNMQMTDGKESNIHSYIEWEKKLYSSSIVTFFESNITLC